MSSPTQQLEARYRYDLIVDRITSSHKFVERMCCVGDAINLGSCKAVAK